MTQILHDLRVFVWGYLNDHPNFRETRIAFTPWLSVIQHPFTSVNHYSLRFPTFHIFNSYEMEQDFMADSLGGNRSWMQK